MKHADLARFEGSLSERAKLVPPGPAPAAQLGQRPALFDFGGGRPDPGSFPYAGLLEATRQVFDREGPEALTYGALPGYQGLKELICWKLRHFEQAEVTPDEIFVTNGSSQAFGIIVDALIDPGDDVIVEAPSFSGSLAILRKHGAILHGVPIDRDGLRTDLLADTLHSLAVNGRRAKLIYTIDTFQNPAGPSLSLERRHELLRLAQEHGAFVVEDDAYGEIRFSGEVLPSLYALDDAGIVLRTGTLSKILGAGLRLGWVTAPPEFMTLLMSLKQDWGTNPFVSRVATYYLREHLEEHVRTLVGVYRAKRDAMLAGLTEGLGESASWNTPEGGFFIWLRLPAGTDLARLNALAAEARVSFAGGPGFYADGIGPNGIAKEEIRLAFSYAALDVIPEGTARLCAAIRAAR